MTGPTLHQLREAEKGYALVAAEAETLRARRNALIHQAIATGLTHAQISEATGLTRARVGQIAQGAPDSEPPRGKPVTPRRPSHQPGPNVENIRSSAQVKGDIKPIPKGKQ